MSGVQEIRELAEHIHDLRPTWDITAISNQLIGHRTQPIAVLGPAAIRCAQDTTNRTPAALGWMELAKPKPGEREVGKGPACFICGRSRAGCEQARDLEVQRGIPDIHAFETYDDADRNAARAQLAGALAAQIRAKNAAARSTITHTTEETA